MEHPYSENILKRTYRTQMLFLSDGYTVVVKTQKSVASWNLYILYWQNLSQIRQ